MSFKGLPDEGELEHGATDVGVEDLVDADVGDHQTRERVNVETQQACRQVGLAWPDWGIRRERG